MENENEEALIHMIANHYSNVAKLIMNNNKVDYNYRTPEGLITNYEGYEYCIPGGKTIFSFACFYGEYELCSMMMNDVDVTVMDTVGRTALYHSMEHPRIFEMIIPKFDMGILNGNNDTVLTHLCLQRDSSLEMIELVLNHKTDCKINYKRETETYDGTFEMLSALDFAIEYKTPDIVKTLLGHGATGGHANGSDEIQKLLDNRFTFLPKWDRFKTYRYYPKEFNDIALHFVMCCKNLFPKDIVYLLVEYLAEEWKLVH